MFKKILSLLSLLLTLCCIAMLGAIAAVFYFVFNYSKNLPDYSQLARYNPPTITRLYAADGRLISEYAKEKRIYVPINIIPKRLKQAFIAAEDKNFYQHPGIDFMSIVRAAMLNIMNYGKQKSLVGGSTITQQVVKNFLLTNERSFSRKIKEAILAFRITQAFSKERILELYLNEIYLGNRSYGVAAAALYYFNKSIDELSIEESAMLAALPKAPSSLDPYRNPERAKERRDWVIKRMEEEGFINEVDSVLSMSKPITLSSRDETEIVKADAFAEAVRTELSGVFGEEMLYEGGLAIRTTLDPKLQEYADKALQDGIIAYDRRHGYREPVAHIQTDNWKQNLNNIVRQANMLENWQLAVVIRTDEKSAAIGLKDGTIGTITLDNMSWAKKFINRNTIDKKPDSAKKILKTGDVIAVSQIQNSTKNSSTEYELQQIPQINGALIALDPHNGRIHALSGGFNYEGSQFNRTTQAKRQPGSAFKPFVYLAALENGFYPNSIIVDEEIQLTQGENLPEWKPQNYSRKFYGPTTLRVGLEKSRNAMTVRLAQLMGIDKVLEIANRYHLNNNGVRNYSLALGSAETSLITLTSAYASFVNGGKVVNPIMVERVQDESGKTIFRSNEKKCLNCQVGYPEEIIGIPMQHPKIPPILLDERQQIINPINSYQMVSMLEGVISRGTGRRARDINKTIAGKTGTTNDSFDAWFIGFSANLVAGVYMGFDQPETLGKNETGATVALPVWKDFMKKALENKPDIAFRRPEGVKLVRIDKTTGLLPSPATPKHNIIFEAFKAGTEPTSVSNTTINNDSVPELDSGNIY